MAKVHRIVGHGVVGSDDDLAVTGQTLRTDERIAASRSSRFVLLLRSFARDAAAALARPDPDEKGLATRADVPSVSAVSIMEERVEELAYISKSKEKQKLKETTMHKRERSLSTLLFQQADDSFNMNVLLRQLLQTVELCVFFCIRLGIQAQTPPKCGE